MTSLKNLMQEQLSEGGIAVPYGRNSHMEVVEVATGRVWMSAEPATQQDYDLLLKELDDSLGCCSCKKCHVAFLKMQTFEMLTTVQSLQPHALASIDSLEQNSRCADFLIAVWVCVLAVQCNSTA